MVVSDVTVSLYLLGSTDYRALSRALLSDAGGESTRCSGHAQCRPGMALWGDCVIGIWHS